MKYKWLFIGLLILSFIIRVAFLGSRPAGFTWDEAALGYNAYSLLKTGRDEHGHLFPLIFKSFGDYKPGLYIYFTVPSVKLFGLNEFSTRLPSAIFGTLLLAVLFVLSRLLFTKNLVIGYWLLVIGAVNPWLINFSRGAWESNLNLFLTVLAVTSFIFALHKKTNIYYLISSALYGFTFLTYQSAKLFTPMIILSLLIIYKKYINFKKTLLPLLLLLLLLLPVILNFRSQSGRLQVFNLFSYTRRPSDVTEILNQDHTASKNWIYYLYHTETLDQFRGVLQRYLNHFSPRFLFMEGDWTNLRHTVFRQGNFYLIEFVFIIIGLGIVFYKLPAKSSKLILSWLLIAPIPSALSRDLVSGVRSLSQVVPLLFLSAIGLSQISKQKILLFILSIFTIFLSAYYFEFSYFHGAFYSGKDWLTPYKQAWQIIKSQKDNYQNIYFTDQLGQPYIFGLFYLSYDPAKYQAQKNFLTNNQGDVGVVINFDKYYFQPIFWPSLKSQSSALVVGGEYELPEKDLNIPELVRLADITYPDGSLGLRIVGLP